MIAVLALLLFFVPPAFGNDIYALPKAAAVCLVIAELFWRQRPVTWPHDLRPWALLAAALAVSTVFSYDLGYSLVSIEHSRGLGLFQWGVCALVFLYSLNVDIWSICDGVFWGSMIAAGWALFQFVLWRGRSGSTQGGPVVLGEALVVCFPMTWDRWPLLGFLITLAVISTGSRSALAALVVVIGYLEIKRQTA